MFDYLRISWISAPRGGAVACHKPSARMHMVTFVYARFVQTKLGNVRLLPNKVLVRATLKQDVLQILMKNLSKSLNIDVEQVIILQFLAA